MRNRARFQAVATAGLFLMVLGISTTCAAQTQTAPPPRKVEVLPVPGIDYQPRHYVCYRTPGALVIDGRLDENPWRQADWTDSFTDIEGSLQPAPRFETKAKLLWDSVYLYIGAQMEEPDVWGTLVQRDAVIYHDNDFEVFIDPDMDTHEYYELELNALNTVWDLFLLKPYRDGGPAMNAWDIQGLKTEVAINGTLNRPGDVDSGWSVEIAIPWAVLSECAHRSSPPKDGDQWKINFSRVEWKTCVNNGAYTKVLDPATGKPLPEDNWVWSPQGLIAMHYPEMWGMVQFNTTDCGSFRVDFVLDAIDPARWALRRLFYAERNYYNTNGQYTAALSDLDLEAQQVPGFDWPPSIHTTPVSFDAELVTLDGKMSLRIREDGRLDQVSR